MTSDPQSAVGAQGSSDADRAKRAAARRAAELVEDGTRLGIGTGSTTRHLIERLGERTRRGLRVQGVATSEETERLAREAGIAMVSLEEAGWLDLTIDGADEFDAGLNLVKGGGGALLREKIVATASDRMVVIADPSKEVEALGAFPLPVEVVRFGWTATKTLLEEALAGLGAATPEARLRARGGDPFVTDEGHYLLDLHLGRIEDPRRVALAINQIAGVVENGLFVDVCDAVVLGRADGGTELREPGPARTNRERGAPVPPDNAFAGV